MDRLNAWTDKDWNLKQKVPSHIAISCRISLSDSTLFFGPRADSALKVSLGLDISFWRKGAGGGSGVFPGRISDGSFWHYVAIVNIQLWKEIMGKGCDTEDAVEEYYRKFRDNYTTVAKSENFEGGDTNKYVKYTSLFGLDCFRCLHKFFIRYTNYDEEIYEAFAGIMAEILFIEVSVHIYCARQLRRRKDHA